MESGRVETTTGGTERPLHQTGRQPLPRRGNIQTCRPAGNPPDHRQAQPDPHPSRVARPPDHRREDVHLLSLPATDNRIPAAGAARVSTQLQTSCGLATYEV